MSTALARLYAEAGRLVTADPALRAFATWPVDPPWTEHSARAIPATLVVSDMAGSAMLDAVAAAAPTARWEQTYTEAEVGRAYLNAYGWFELLGPEGHFHAADLRAFLGYWGPGLRYPEHSHPASEIYAVLSGDAVFEIAGRAPIEALPGDTVEMPPGAQHAMQIGDQGLLVFALWRGAGLSQNAKLEGAA